jgi:putative endonuclease
MKGAFVHTAARALDKLSDAVGSEDNTASHLVTGQAGEDAAYFHLRKLGYVMVARNWRVPQCKGELDLVAWDGEMLCFVEVKTRTTHDVKPAEAAVDAHKRRELAVMARNFLHRLRREQPPPYRFDVVSVYFSTDASRTAGRAIPAHPGAPASAEITLFKNAFSVP